MSPIFLSFTPHTHLSPEFSFRSYCSSSWTVSAVSLSCSSCLEPPTTLYRLLETFKVSEICRNCTSSLQVGSMRIRYKFTDCPLLLPLGLISFSLFEGFSVFPHWENPCFSSERNPMNFSFWTCRDRIWSKKFRCS